jgi:chromosome segregation protein
LRARAEAERRVETCRAELSAVASRYASIKELNENFEGYGDGVRKFMSNGGRERAGALGVVAELIEIEKGYERAVAAVLEDRLQYVVVPDPEAGVRGAAYLRDTGAGRASFIPRAPRLVPTTAPNSPPSGYSLLSQHVSARAGYEGIVSTLLEDVVVADTLETATEQWKRNGTYVTFVTREGEVLDKAGIITGGSGRPLDEGYSRVKSSSVRSSRRSARPRSILPPPRVRSSCCGARAKRRGTSCPSLDRRLHELTVARVAAEKDLELHRQNLARTHERAQSVSSELASLAEEDGRLRERLVRLPPSSPSSKRRYALVRPSEQHLESTRLELDSCLKQRVSDLEGLRVREAELRQQREHWSIEAAGFARRWKKRMGVSPRCAGV